MNFSIIRMINTFFWYFKRPFLYEQLLFHACEMIVYAKQNSEENESLASAWCEKQAITPKEALKKITGSEKPSIKKLYPEEFEYAEEAINKCPVKMGGAGDLDLIFHLAEFFEANHILETGVAYGWSSLSLLLSVKNRESGRLISVDMPYKNLENEKYVGFVVPEKLRKKWTLIRKADRQGIPQALLEMEEIDFCHHDSDKYYNGRMWAYKKIWSVLKPNGCFVFDDIGDNFAFRDFAESLSEKPLIIRSEIPGQDKYIGILVKGKGK